MEYDLFESVSQGKYGENAPQISRMEEVADFLFRSCTKNEAKSCDGTSYGGDLYSEQGFIEKYAEQDVEISDLKPKNVLVDVDGDLYVIDAEIKFLIR